MQEESSEKLVVLSVRCTKLTAEVLQKSMKVMLNQMKKEKEKLAHPRGKQSLKSSWIRMSALPALRSTTKISRATYVLWTSWRMV